MTRKGKGRSNPSIGTGQTEAARRPQGPKSQTPGQNAQDPKRRLGDFGGTGEAHRKT